MNVTNSSNAITTQWGAYPTNAVSGASGWTPPASSPSDLAIRTLRTEIKQNFQDFKALKTSLGSNDLTGASQAFTALQQAIQKASQQTGGRSLFDPSSPIGKDFQTLGDALKSGDLAAAQDAFAAFRKDIRGAGRAARAQHRGGNDGDADDGGKTPPPGSVFDAAA